jgi:hypothetical protein
MRFILLTAKWLLLPTFMGVIVDGIWIGEWIY